MSKQEEGVGGCGGVCGGVTGVGNKEAAAASV